MPTHAVRRLSPASGAKADQMHVELMISHAQSTLKKPLESIGQVTLKPLNLDAANNISLNADASNGAICVEILAPQFRAHEP